MLDEAIKKWELGLTDALGSFWILPKSGERAALISQAYNMTGGRMEEIQKKFPKTLELLRKNAATAEEKIEKRFLLQQEIAYGSNEVSAEEELTVDMMRTIARHTRGQKLKLSHWSWMTMDLDNINSGRFVFSTLGV